MHGYDTYDIVWRQYYPAIMRFQTPDPEVENDYDLSPYTMCDNNMKNRTDPDGRFWDTVLDVGFTLYDVGEAAYQYHKTGHVSATTKAALAADALAIVIPGVTGSGGAVRMAAHTADAVKTGEHVVDGVKTGNHVADAAKGEGIIYKRTNPKTGKEYIGQAKSEAHYQKRQKAHDKSKGVKHDYEVVDRGNPGKDLDVKEETAIRRGGGPKNKSNNGTLENKRPQMNDKRYKDAGGTQ